MTQRFTLGHFSPEHQRQIAEQMGKPSAAALSDVLRRELKYHNKPSILDGERFDSKWELQRWTELRNQETVGLITDLKRQVPFSLDAWTPDGPVRLGAYIADAMYRRDGEVVVEDTKSAATRREKLYVWKRTHFESQYGMRITEVQRQRKRRS